MVFKMKSLLYKFDFIGFIPQFRVLNEFRYKTAFSSILSMIIVIFSIVFVSYSFVDFIHQNPKVEYYKSNDFETNKTFLLSDSLLMFQYFFICISDPRIYEPEMLIQLTVPLEYKYENLEFEPCELGKNINLKYKDLIKEFNSIEKWEMSSYYCVNYNNTNFTLYNHPLLPYEEENYLKIVVNSECDSFLLNFKLITENDFIDQSRSDTPIIPYYKRSEYRLNENGRKMLTYNYQYIKYEYDDGFIFNNKKIINGIGEAGIDDLDAPDQKENIFSINFKINRANYDYYLGTYKKFQTFLAEIMSLINLIISASSVISEFLLYRKMNKDIINYILVSNEKKEYRRDKIVFSKDKIFNQIFPIDKINKKYIAEKKIKKGSKIDDEQISKASFNISNKDDVLKEKSTDYEINNVMRDLDFISIMKSFCCIRGKKLQIINLCNDIVNEDICIERILKRLYTLENNYKLIVEKSNESDLNDNFSGIKKSVTEIDDESSNQTKNPVQTI